MGEAFDWAEAGRVIGVGFGMVILILGGLAIILGIIGVIIRRIETKFGWREKAD
ncbi:MAG: hypothetical protein R6U37_07190 [Dehalococcoidia bacterium]